MHIYIYIYIHIYIHTTVVPLPYENVDVSTQSFSTKIFQRLIFWGPSVLVNSNSAQW